MIDSKVSACGVARPGLYQRLLALTDVIWHNDYPGRPIKRSLLAYDH